MHAEAAPQRPILTVSGLRLVADARAGHGEIELVAGAMLHAYRGEILGVVGESGSGKSLTLRAIAGLLPPGVRVAGGEIDVAGIDAVRGSAKDLRRLNGQTVGMVFQEPMSALNPTMRIGPQIAEAVAAHSGSTRAAAKSRAVELLGRMGFKEPGRQYRLYPHELSGGMRQRVMIAIALAGDPPLLLCDEPTTALDATVTMRVLDLLGDLVRELNIGIVFVTHDLGVAARICNRLVVMYAGRVVEEGPADAVLRRPRHPYTLALLRAVPTRGSRVEDLRAIPGAPPSAGEQLPGCSFAPRCAFSLPECLEPVPLIALGSGRMSACIRHELLADMAGRARD